MVVQADKAEFKDFIIRNKRETIVRLAVFFLALLIYLCIFMFAEGYMKLNQGIERLDYDYVVLSEEPDGNNTYIKFLNLATVETDDGRINVNAYMQSTDGTYRQSSPLYYEKLGVNEIVVSEKIATKLKLDIGSSVKLNFILSEREVPYVVKGILEYTTDYYDFKGNHDFSVILIGYDDEIFQKNRNQYISFLNEDELKVYQDNMLSYKDLIYVETEKATIKNESLLVESLLIGIHILMFGLYCVVIRRVVMREMKRYYYDGFSTESINYFLRAYRRRIILLPWMISFVLVLTVGKESISLKYWTVGFVVEIMLYGVIWIRNSAYGKADRI